MDDFAGDGGGRYGRRVLLYSHDTFGLGHLRRSRTIAIAIVHRRPRHSGPSLAEDHQLCRSTVEPTLQCCPSFIVPCPRA